MPTTFVSFFGLAPLDPGNAEEEGVVAEVWRILGPVPIVDAAQGTIRIARSGFASAREQPQAMSEPSCRLLWGSFRLVLMSFCPGGVSIDRRPITRVVLTTRQTHRFFASGAKG